MTMAQRPVAARPLILTAIATGAAVLSWVPCDPCGFGMASASTAPAADDAAPAESSEAPAATTPEVLSTEPWTFGGQTGLVIRTRHYRIYTTEKNQVLRDRMASFTEHALTHYRTAIIRLPAPPQRLDTYLMDTRPQWEQVTKLLMGEQSEQLVKIQRGGFASRGIGVYYDLGLFDTMAIAAHEG